MAAAEDIQSKLVLDLSGLGAQVQQIEQRQQQADARTDAVVRRVAVAEQQVRSVDLLATRLEQKIKSVGKTLFKQGLGAGIVAGLDAIDLGEDPLANYGKNVFTAAASGFVFSGGNLGVAGVSALAASVLSLRGLYNDLQQRQKEIEKRIVDKIDKEREELVKFIREEGALREALRKQNDEIIFDAKEELKELMYQAVAVEAREDQ